MTIKELINTPSAVEILESFDGKVSGSNVILARALQDTQIQLINPANQSLLSKMIQHSVKRCGGCTVFIDGALDRLSHGSSSLIDGVFVCSGVQADGELSRIIEKTELLIATLESKTCDGKIKQMILEKDIKRGCLLIRDHRIIDCISGTLLDTTDLDEKIKNNDIIYTTGVITDKIIRRYLDREFNVTIVLIDGTKCYISKKTSDVMKRRGIQIRVLNPIPVYGLAVNSVGIRRSMNPSKVLRAFRHAFQDKWVFDTQYLG